MPLAEHLGELRRRVVVSVLSLVPGTIVGFVFSGPIIHWLRSPLPTSDPLIALGLTDAFTIQMKVALVAGVIVAMPVLLFELWRFVSPALTARERAAARPWAPLALAFFALGVGVAYVILPYAAGFLYNFRSRDIQPMLTATGYFGFVTTLFVAFGLMMEFPIVLVLLSKAGLVTSARLRRSRRQAVLGVTLFAAIITPGADFVSPIVLAVVMYGLFEASIVMISLGHH
jgi:sec-independent protein translocase protein TatC